MEVSASNLRRLNKRKPLIVVLSGPSGVGKSTLVERLLQRNRNFVESVSATTRIKRAGERHGRDYFFMTPATFRNKRRRGEFIETARIFDAWYGTPKQAVLNAIAKGRTVLFDIDILGGRAIKRWRQEAILIFVMPPSLAALKRRLLGRKTESSESARKRLGRALKEMKVWTKYDYVVCNDDLEATVALIDQIIRAESQRVTRCGTINLME